MILKEGEYLFLEGDKATNLVIVKSGMLVGTNKLSRQNRMQNFGPGSLIGEFSILESKPREFTVRAAEKSEVLFIEQATLNRELEQKTDWFKSTLSFLANHCHIAEDNQRKRKVVQALPAFLFLFGNHLTKVGSDHMELAALQKKMLVLHNTSHAETDKLLQILEEIGIVKLDGDMVRATGLSIVPLLYETLRHRAICKQVSPNILPITDQMLLNAFVKAVRDNGIAVKDGIATVSAELLNASAKKTMYGATLNLRTVTPLLQQGILVSEPAFSEQTALEDIRAFSGEFERIQDLLELNRIFPLLDKKLVS